MVEKLKCYLCAIAAAAPFFISFLSLKIIQNFKNVVVLFPAQPHPLGFRRKRKLLRFAAKAKIMKILVQALNFKEKFFKHCENYSDGILNINFTDKLAPNKAQFADTRAPKRSTGITRILKQIIKIFTVFGKCHVGNTSSHLNTGGQAASGQDSILVRDCLAIHRAADIN